MGRWRGVVALAAAMAGCGDARTDKQVCDDACAKLILCGVLYEQSACSTNCQTNAPLFLSCARRAADTCNDLALCVWQNTCAGTGTPSGGASCLATATC